MSSDKMASLNIEVVKKQKKIGSMAKSDADAPKTIQIGDDRVAPERHKIDTQTQKVRERERAKNGGGPHPFVSASIFIGRARTRVEFIGNWAMAA